MAISFFGINLKYMLDEGRFSSLSEALTYYKARGVDVLDVFDSEMKEWPISYYSQILKEHDMSIGCLINHDSIAHPDPFVRECQIAKSKELLETAAKYEIPMLMLQPRMEPAKSKEEYEIRRELMVEGFSRLTEYATSLGVTMTLENVSWFNRTDCTIEEIRYLLENVPDLKFILDTGNFLCVGEDPLTAYRELKDRIVHMHCKDWIWDDFGGFYREKLPRFEGAYLGEGVVPLKQILYEAKQDGYNGNLLVEINLSFHPDWNRFDGCIDFLKENF